MNSSSSSKNEDFSQTSTNCNEQIAQLNSENNVTEPQKPKFEKKTTEALIKKQRSRLSLLNAKTTTTSLESKKQTLKKEIFQNTNAIYKYRIFFFCQHLKTMVETLVFLDSSLCVNDAILEIIKCFNEKFTKENIPISFKEESSSFELYLSKKNGCAKKDLPSLDCFQIISLTHIKTFTLCEKSCEVIVDLRKASSDSSESSNSEGQKLENTPSTADRSSSIAIANQSYYANSLINMKGKQQNEDNFYEDCQKHMFCGIFKLFGKTKEKKQEILTSKS